MKTIIWGSIFFGLVFTSFSWSQYSFDLSCLSDTLQVVEPNDFASFNFRLANTGSQNDIYELNCKIIESIPGWFANLCVRGRCVEPGILLYDTLNVGQFDTAIHISVYTTSTTGQEILSLNVRSLGDPMQKDSIRVYTQVGQGIEETRTTHNTLPLTLEIYPNPFKTQSAVRFTLNSLKADIELKIYDVLGNPIKSFSTNPQSPYSKSPLSEARRTTNHCLVWDGRDQNGQLLPNGSYIVTFIHNGEAIISKRMVLIK